MGPFSEWYCLYEMAMMRLFLLPESSPFLARFLGRLPRAQTLAGIQTIDNHSFLSGLRLL